MQRTSSDGGGPLLTDESARRAARVPASREPAGAHRTERASAGFPVSPQLAHVFIGVSSTCRELENAVPAG